MRARTARLAGISALVAGALLGAAPPAQANHHFMSIREVYPGDTTAGSTAEWVELQMYSAGQTIFMGNDVRIKRYDFMGNQIGNDLCSTNPASGDNQRTVLFATSSAVTAFGLTPDCTLGDSDNLTPAAGAVCFTSTLGGIDCVSWGAAFPGIVGGAPSPTGTPEGAIPNANSIERSIAPLCPTLLEGGDDTNNSSTDFSPVSPTPEDNGDTPGEAPCNTLQVLRSGTGTGTVMGNGSPAINCPSTCFSFFTPVQTASLTAAPGANSAFTSWTNCPTPSGMDCDALMNVSRTVTANFASTLPPPTNPTPITPTASTTGEDPACAPLRAKLKKAKSKRKKRQIRSQLKKLGC